MEKLANNINSFFKSVSSDLVPITGRKYTYDGPVPIEYQRTVEQIQKLLMQVKVSKAPGPDGIPNWILRDCAALIASPVCALFNPAWLHPRLLERGKCNTDPKGYTP